MPEMISKHYKAFNFFLMNLFILIIPLGILWECIYE